jgi:Protein of unknown function (DUF1549)/Protein of unknown function (DUF1553)/Planctomycete cytochrome C
MPRLSTILLAGVFLTANAVRAESPKEAPKEPQKEAQKETPKRLSFEADVRPILKAHCFHCHGDEADPKARLDLRLVRFARHGGDSGPALVPGKPAESLLIDRIMADEMPPDNKTGNKKLSAREKETIRQWIEQGSVTLRPEPETIAPGSEALNSQWTEEERNFWSLQPIRRAPVPQVQQSQFVRSPIDAFLLAELEKRGLSFSAQADRPALIRRLSFDLTGLPPSPERVTAFVADNAPDAYERLVDELLESPAYGERWGRHWLDPAGYADSDGYTETDPPRPWAYRYRDYVIRAFNADKPFDQFIVEQLAGDELLTPPYANLAPEEVDRLTATGYLRMAPDGTADGGADQNAARNDVMAETIKIVSTSLLGLTVGCAQCHNHRYDPISQEDYYRFRAIFEPALDVKNWRTPGARLVSLWSEAEKAQAIDVDKELAEIAGKRTAEQDMIVQEIFDKEVAKLDEPRRELARAARKAPPAERTAEHQQLLKDHPSLNVDRGSAYLYEPQRIKDCNKKYDDMTAATKARRPAENFVACLTEVPGQVAATQLFFRGDFRQPRHEVVPGELSVLGAQSAAIPPKDEARPTTGRRLALARSLTSGKHPLVGRTLVNRIWMHHFGRGLVGTPGDLGFLGERPSHPELLDWLADEFVRTGWRLKGLHRLLVNSTAYRQSSLRSPALQQIDPENRLLARMSIRRLEAEAIRDAIVEISGCRSPKMFGPPVTVVPDDVGQIVLGTGMRDGNGILVGGPEALGGDQFRRSLYVQARRSMPLGMLEPFDAWRP